MVSIHATESGNCNFEPTRRRVYGGVVGYLAAGETTAEPAGSLRA